MIKFWLSDGCLTVARLWDRANRWAIHISEWCQAKRNLWMQRADAVLGEDFAELDVTGIDDPVERIEHGPLCGANLPWDKCTCGLFQGWHLPLGFNGNHKDNCPCHCTCDFWNRLTERLTRE